MTILSRDETLEKWVREHQKSCKWSVDDVAFFLRSVRGALVRFDRNPISTDSGDLEYFQLTHSGKLRRNISWSDLGAEQRRTVKACCDAERARFFRTFSQAFLVCKGDRTLGRLDRPDFLRVESESTVAPTLLCSKSGLAYWLYHQQMFSTPVHVENEEARALITALFWKNRQHVEQLIGRSSSGEASERRHREPISDEVKIFVWRRDDGQCVKCNGIKELEFDHVIPLALGGSNTARNLQLLCAQCNRKKGPNLA